MRIHTNLEEEDRRKVKDYADMKGLKVRQAYTDLIRSGLRIGGMLDKEDLDYECEMCGNHIFFVDKFNPDINPDQKCIICTNCGAVWPIDITGEEQTR